MILKISAVKDGKAFWFALFFISQCECYLDSRSPIFDHFLCHFNSLHCLLGFLGRLCFFPLFIRAGLLKSHTTLLLTIWQRLGETQCMLNVHITTQTHSNTSDWPPVDWVGCGTSCPLHHQSCPCHQSWAVSCHSAARTCRILDLCFLTWTAGPCAGMPCLSFCHPFNTDMHMYWTTFYQVNKQEWGSGKSNITRLGLDHFM